MSSVKLDGAAGGTGAGVGVGLDDVLLPSLGLDEQPTNMTTINNTNRELMNLVIFSSSLIYHSLVTLFSINTDNVNETPYFLVYQK
jgi:hypothetical protein